MNMSVLWDNEQVSSAIENENVHTMYSFGKDTVPNLISSRTDTTSTITTPQTSKINTGTDESLMQQTDIFFSPTNLSKHDLSLQETSVTPFTLSHFLNGGKIMVG